MVFEQQLNSQRNKSLLGESAALSVLAKPPQPTTNYIAGFGVLFPYNKQKLLDPSQSKYLFKPPTARGTQSEVIGGNFTYKRLFRCVNQTLGKDCYAKFRTYEQLAKHTEKKHSGKSIQYDFVVVDEHYIKSRIDECHSKVVYFNHDKDCNCTEHKVIPNSCFIRVCPKCEGVRRNRYIKSFRHSLLSFNRVSVVTLTVKDHHPLSKVYKHQLELDIRNFIKRLRRRYPKLQYSRVLEIKRKVDGWYYHYHFLMDICFIQQQQLSRMWYECNGSPIVGIEILKSNGQAVGMVWSRLPIEKKMSTLSLYISKYLAKPTGDLTYDEYARFVYGSQFTHSRLNLINVQSSSIQNGLICKKCGQPFYYSHIEEQVVYEPPDSCFKGVNNLERFTPNV